VKLKKSFGNSQAKFQLKYQSQEIWFYSTNCSFMFLYCQSIWTL